MSKTHRYGNEASCGRPRPTRNTRRVLERIERPVKWGRNYTHELREQEEKSQ